MATAIVFYAGEGSDQRELATNKELVILAMSELRAPVVIREDAAQQFVQQRFRAPLPAWEDYVDSMVIAVVIDDEGRVESGEQYETAYRGY